VQRFRVKGAGAGQPGLVVETDDVDDERIALPAADRIADVGGTRVVRVLRIERDRAEDVHVFVHEDDPLRRLHDLDWKQADEGQAWHPRRQAARGGIVDTASIEQREHARGRLRLVGCGVSNDLLRRQAWWRRRIGSDTADTEAVVGLLPCAATFAAPLPDPGQVGFAVGGARNRRLPG